MTITIDPKTEAGLREKADREGRSVDALANAVLAWFLEEEARELRESVEAIRVGMEDHKAGRARPLREYIADLRAQRGLPDTWPSSKTIVEVSPGVFEDAD